jgi:hypothetical protein
MPEPFLFPSPTSRGTFKTDTTQESLLSLSMIDAGRPLSLSIIDAGRPLPLSMIDAGYPLSLSVIDAGHLQTPVTATTTSTPKSAVPPQLRPINIIQHDDAGPSEDPASRVEPRTIELPPAYSNIRQKPRSPLATSTTPHTVRHDS